MEEISSVVWLEWNATHQAVSLYHPRLFRNLGSVVTPVTMEYSLPQVWQRYTVW